MPTIVSHPQSTIHLHSTTTKDSMQCHHHHHNQIYTHQQANKVQEKGFNRQTVTAIDDKNKHTVPDTVTRYHTRLLAPNQTSSAVIQHIAAPLPTVWSLLRQFDNPQTYKHFLKSCNILAGDGRAVGTLREVHVVSGLPAANSTERLDILDEDRHVIGFSVVGGDHRLSNYKSVTTLHSSATGTVVVESYEVDVPEENSKEDTCVFVDTIVRCNLQSLATIAQSRSQSNTVAVAARG